MPKRACRFNDELQKEYPFLKKCCTQDDRVKCSQCGSEFSLAHGGRSDIKDHLTSNKHKKSLLAAAGTSKMSSFFKTSNASEKNLHLAAKEATFAYHTTNHNLSFNSNVCSSKLISKFFEPNFSLGKTKCEAIVLNVLSPFAMKELQEDLNKSNFVSVSMDASNKKELKLVPIVVRYFKPESGVQVKLLDFKSVPGETAEILSNHLISFLKKNDLEKKVVGFCGDNCNTNFGGVKRKGKNNVFTLIKGKIGRHINGIGCGAHIVHNSVQTTVDVMPIEIEALVVKIYKYFHIYTVRVTQLQGFCDFAHIEYHKVLRHGNTRFLSLMPAIERILQIFTGLKEYFSSQEMCPVLIKNFFDDEFGEIYLWFVHGQLALFNKTILAMEKTQPNATDVAGCLQNLKTNLLERSKCNFIPFGAERILKSFERNDEIKCKKAKEVFQLFYKRCISYLELWENSFGDAYKFKWVNLNEIVWEEIQSSAGLINENLGDPMISLDDLFDEVVLAKKFWTSQVGKWKEEEKEKEIKLTSEEKWLQLFNYFQERDISMHNLWLTMEYIFCLPGTSAPVERVFSLMNNMWSDDRSLMNESTVRGLLLCKVNIALSCTDFFEKVKNRKDLLQKIISSEKYV